jgi:hypothetical protein
MKEKLIGVSIFAVVLSGIAAIAYAGRRTVWKVGRK